MEVLKKKLAWGVRYHRQHARYSGVAGLCSSAAEWQKSLIDRLTLGWTSKGQTNELIRTACVLAWVFGDGSRNDAAIVEKLVNMPGYREFCGHQHEIESRVKEWMDCVTKQYWPYCRPDMRPFASMRDEQPAAAKEKSTERQDDVLERIRQVVAAVIEQPLPIKVSEIIQLIQETAKKIFGKGFGINTLYNQKYVPEWRILVEKAQSHIQQVLSHISPEPETTKKSGSNLEPVSSLSHFVSMKVGNQVKIAALNFLLAVERGIDSVTNLLTDRSENLEFETECSIETDKFISFTNSHTPPGAAPAAISRPNQSSLERDSAALLLAISRMDQGEVSEPPDDHWLEFGSLLTPLPNDREEFPISNNPGNRDTS
jgi:hypothetical protein